MLCKGLRTDPYRVIGVGERCSQEIGYFKCKCSKYDFANIQALASRLWLMWCVCILAGH